MMGDDGISVNHCHRERAPPEGVWTEITKSAWQISNSSRPYGASHQHRYIWAVVEVDQDYRQEPQRIMNSKKSHMNGRRPALSSQPFIATSFFPSLSDSV